MRMIDLFCGTKSIANVFSEAGHETMTLDYDPQFNADFICDILEVTADDLLDYHGWDSVDYVHASPDCTTYSIAACYRHRNKDRSPKSDYAELSDRVTKHALKLIDELNPKFYTIENPRGILRKMPWMQKFKRRDTVTYCQYGDTRMKPTDIWNNLPDECEFKPACKNGDTCHTSAPRGSKTGTQGLSSAKHKSIIPRELCEEIRGMVEYGMVNYYE